MAIYLEHDKIKGNVAAAGYENSIKVSSVHFSVARPPVSKNTESTVGNETFNEVTITKKVDKTSPQFYKEFVAGESGKKTILIFGLSGKKRTKKSEKFMIYTLHDSVITSYAASAEAGKKPKERITLSFSKGEIL